MLTRKLVTIEIAIGSVAHKIRNRPGGRFRDHHAPPAAAIKSTTADKPMTKRGTAGA